MASNADYALSLQRLKYLETAEEMRAALPHLYGWKYYPWARKFFESTNRMNLISAANQISKSSIMIRKTIHWATATELWPKLWVRPPLTFWYGYPTKDVATAEFQKKWIPEFMPKEALKNHPIYGWRAEYSNSKILAVHFNTGVTVFFKTYGQDVMDLQTGTVWSLFCFASGTKVLTAKGELPIEDVHKGDQVLTMHGWRSVTSVSQSRSSVITRRFCKAGLITATEDHLFFTQNRGWVQFGRLTEKDICYNLPECTSRKRLLFWMASPITAIRNIRTIVGEIILRLSKEISFCTSHYGKRLIKPEYQKNTSSITKISIPSTIALKICRFLRELSIRGFISLRNGDSRGIINFYARYVAKNFYRVAQSVQHLVTVLCRAVNPVTQKISSVKNAIVFSLFAKILRRDSVQNSVRIEGSDQEVFDLRVEGARSFFANGILVHNCDEELPEDLYSELQFRLAATDGYWHGVFTPTLGQDFWRCAIEEKGKYERFPHAFKQQVSMYDCLFYDDGTPSPWKLDQIKRAEASCKSEAEKLRRVFGRFVTDSGLKYPAFVRSRHFKEGHPVPKDWLLFVGADPGSGGDNHPAAVALVAVKPDYTMGRVIGGWRGDEQQTDAGFVVSKARELAALTGLQLGAHRYDYSCRDYYTIAQEMGVDVEPAEKSHAVGEQVINVLFKNDMLFVYDLPELEPLAVELSTLKLATPKTKAKDDFADALRYALTAVPWDWSVINGKKQIEAVRESSETDLRRQMFFGSDNMDLVAVDEEIASYNELIGGHFSDDCYSEGEY